MLGGIMPVGDAREVIEYAAVREVKYAAVVAGDTHITHMHNAHPPARGCQIYCCGKRIITQPQHYI